jgi:uncharacterized protein (PEP-CTERM system associated)
MTITTVKPAWHARLPRLTPLAAAALLLLAPPSKAEWRFTPSVGLTQTYTDNVSLQPGPSARSQWVTEATPGFSLVGDSRRLKLAATSQWHYFAYRDGGLPNTADRQHQYNLSAQGIVADDLLYVDAAASGGPHSVSAFGPQVTSNLYSLGNRTEIETWRISPYLLHRFGNSATASLRYTRDSVDAGAHNLFGSSIGDTVAFNLASGPAFHTLGWGLSYQRQDLDNRLAGESSSESALGSLRYRLTPRLALTATLGYDRYDYQALGGRTEGRSWSGGFAWNPSRRTSLEASLGRHYYGNTGSLAATHRSRHSVWSINYGDQVITSRSQLLLPAAIDTADLLDRLFSVTIPDPLARQQAVAAYMLATGLPPSLADNVNYLSNRYMRQKLLRASSAFNWSRSTAVLSLFASERNALSSHESDSELLGSRLATLNDNVRQKGASATYSYRFNSRSMALASASATHTRSLTTGIEDRQRVVRVGLTRQYGAKVRGAFEVRRQSGGTDAASGRDYRENAISASLSIQY